MMITIYYIWFFDKVIDVDCLICRWSRRNGRDSRRGDNCEGMYFFNIFLNFYYTTLHLLVSHFSRRITSIPLRELYTLRCFMAENTTLSRYIERKWFFLFYLILSSVFCNWNYSGCNRLLSLVVQVNGTVVEHMTHTEVVNLIKCKKKTFSDLTSWIERILFDDLLCSSK